jgi:hypothetical protein
MKALRERALAAASEALTVATATLKRLQLYLVPRMVHLDPTGLAAAATAAKDDEARIKQTGESCRTECATADPTCLHACFKEKMPDLPDLPKKWTTCSKLNWSIIAPHQGVRPLRRLSPLRRHESTGAFSSRTSGAGSSSPLILMTHCAILSPAHRTGRPNLWVESNLAAPIVYPWHIPGTPNLSSTHSWHLPSFGKLCRRWCSSHVFYGVALSLGRKQVTNYTPRKEDADA